MYDEEIRYRSRELAEAKARPARARQIADYTGSTGASVTVDFGAYFLEEPTFTWGVYFADGRGPESSAPFAAVLEYRRPEDDSPFIHGATVYLTAESTSVRILRFSLVFEAPAMRATAKLFDEEE